MSEVASAVFDAWLERLRAVHAMPDGEEKDRAVVDSMIRMVEEDPTLIVHVENCVDGCCPGELVLSSLVHPTIGPEYLVTVFPELMTKDVVKRRGVIGPAPGEEN